MAVNELTTAYVSIAGSARGLQKSIAKDLSGLGKAGDKAGKDYASRFNKSVEKDIDLDGLAAEVAKVEKKIEATTERSRSKVEAANRKAAIAQKAYSDAVEKSGEGSLKAMQAADRLAGAQERAKKETLEASRALKELNDDLDQARKAHEAGKDAAEAYTKGWRGMGKRLASHTVAGVAVAGIAGKIAAKKAGKESGDSFSSGFGSAIARMSGLRVLKDFGSNIASSIGNLDKAVPKMAGMTMAIGSLGSVAISSVGSIASLAGSIASIAPAALALPGILGGAAIAAGIFSAAMVDIGTVLADLGPKFGALQDSISASFWDQAAQPIRDLVNTLLPAMSGKINEVATNLGFLTGAFASAMSGALPMGQLASMFDYLNQALVIARGAVDPIVSAFMTLGLAGASYLPALAGWITEIANKFNGFITQAAGDGRLHGWITTGIAALQDMGRVITGVAGIFYGLSKAAAAAGGASLGSLADGLHEISAALNSPVGQGALEAIFTSASKGVDGLMVGVRSLGPMLAQLGPTLGRALEITGAAAGKLLTGISSALATSGFATGLNDFLTGLQDGVNALSPSLVHLGPLLGSVLGVAGELARGLGGVLGTAITTLAPVVTNLMNQIKPMIPTFMGIAENIINGVKPAFEFLSNVIVPLVGVVASLVEKFTSLEWVQRLIGPAITLVVAAFGAYKLAMLGVTIQANLATLGITRLGIQTTLLAIKQRAVALATGAWTLALTAKNAVLNAGILATIRSGAVTTALAIKQRAVALATGAWTIAQKALNLAMRMNPIGLVITGLIALGIAVVAAYNKFSWFKRIVDGVWAGLKIATTAVVTWFRDTAMPSMRMALQWVGDKFRWLWNNVVKPVWSGIKTAISIAVAGIKAVFNGLKLALQWVGDKFVNVKNRAVLAWTLLRTSLIVGVTRIKQFALLALRVALQVLSDKFNSVKNRISAIWTNLRNILFVGVNRIKQFSLLALRVALQVLSDKFNSVKNRIGAIWQSLRNLLFNGANAIKQFTLAPLRAALQFLGDKFSSTRNRIREIWDNLKNLLRNGYVSIKQRVFNPLVGFVKNDIPNAFTKMKDAVGKIWDSFQNIAKSPVRFVVNTVLNDAILGNIKKVAKWVGLDDKIPSVSLPKGFARGGILPGYQSAKKDDQLTPMRSGEGVLVPEAVRGLGADFIHGANAAGNRGGTSAVRRWAAERTGAAAGGHDHSHGMAAGIPSGPSGGIWGSQQNEMSRTGRLMVPDTRLRGVSMWDAAKAWVGRSALSIEKGKGSPGLRGRVDNRGPWGYYTTDGNLSVSNSSGNVLGTMVHEIGHALSLGHTSDGTRSVMHPTGAYGWNATGNDYAAVRKVWGKPGEGVKTYNVDTGSGGGGIFSSILSLFVDPVRNFSNGLMDNIAKKVPGGGPWNDLLGGAGKKVVNSVLDWVENAAGGAGGGGAEQWRGTVKRALSHVGLPTGSREVDTILRQIQSESGGNAKIAQQITDVNGTGDSAGVGLMQIIPNTFAAHRDPSLPNDRRDPFANIVAALRYAKTRYGSDGMFNYLGNGHGYAKGGIIPKIPKYDKGGLLHRGTQLINHDRATPDYVLTDKQWDLQMRNADYVARQADSPQNPITVNINGVDANPDEIARIVTDKLSFAYGS